MTPAKKTPAAKITEPAAIVAPATQEPALEVPAAIEEVEAETLPTFADGIRTIANTLGFDLHSLAAVEVNLKSGQVRLRTTDGMYRGVKVDVSDLHADADKEVSA